MKIKWFIKLVVLLLFTTFVLSAPFSVNAEDTDFTIVGGVLTSYNGAGGHVMIPDGVTSIGENAFRGCSGLTGINIPDSVTSIGGWAFYKCTNLDAITISDNITSIDRGAFQYTGLVSIIIPDSVNFLSDYMFIGCASLKNVTIPDGISYIGVDAFYDCVSLESITIPDSVVTIGADALHGCSNLSSIDVGISNINYKSIDGVLFSKDGTSLIVYPNMKSAAYTVPDGVTTIVGDAFYGCDNLGSVTISDSVTSIGAWAFDGCTGLDGITIPSSVTNIGYQAFNGCTNLVGVTIPSSVTIIGDGAFGGCTNLSSIVVDPGNPNYVSIDGVLFSKDGVTLLDYPNAKGSSYTIPNTVSDVGHHAFTNCDRLTSLTIPDHVTSISPGTFNGCLSLSSITVDPGNPIYESIDGVLFSKGGSTLIVYPHAKNSAYVIPNGVTRIGMGAFYECTGLTSVRFPDSITDIEENAFAGCSNLTVVYFEGNAPVICTDEDWPSFGGLADTFKFFYREDATGFTSAGGIWGGYAARQYHVLTFDRQDGSTRSQAYVEYGTTISKPADPARNGFTFAGWYTEAALNQPFDFSTSIIMDKTFYAKWNAVTISPGTGDNDPLIPMCIVGIVSLVTGISSIRRRRVFSMK